MSVRKGSMAAPAAERTTARRAIRREIFDSLDTEGTLAEGEQASKAVFSDLRAHCIVPKPEQVRGHV